MSVAILMKRQSPARRWRHMGSGLIEQRLLENEQVKAMGVVRIRACAEKQLDDMKC